MTDELLPALPEPAFVFDDPAEYTKWTAQMRAYAREAIRQQWRPISEAPVCDLVSTQPEPCLVYGPRLGIHMGRAWRYADGEAIAQAFGFHGNWEITHWTPLPSPPAGEVA